MSTPDPTIEADHFRQVLGQFPTGVVVITAESTGGDPVALTIGSFTSASLDPPLVAFLPQKTSSTWPIIRSHGRFAVNILGADQEGLCRAFARSGTDKFAGVSWHSGGNGAPIIDGSVAWIECDIEHVSDAGDHDIVLGRVTALSVDSGALPLVFFRGGYGRFTPSSLTAIEASLTDILPTVDTVRPVLEQLARHADQECLLVARMGDEFVVLASAGAARQVTPTRVGRRLPYTAPLGAMIAAWSSPDEYQAWLDPHHQLSREEAEAWHELRGVLQDRGYVVGVGDETYNELEDSVNERGGRASSADSRILAALADARRNMARQLPSDSAGVHELRSLSAPVFAGNDVLQLGLYGLTGVFSAHDISTYADLVTGAAEQASALLGGRAPRKDSTA